MRTGIPAAEPYAARAAPAFPAVGATNPATPIARARVTAALIPRALNDAVGFSPSSLIQTVRTPIALAMLGAAIIGVAPSPSDTGSSLSSSGSTAEYLHMSQRALICDRSGHA